MMEPELRLFGPNDGPLVHHPVISETAQEAFDRIRDRLDQPDVMQDIQICSVRRGALWCPCGQWACLWIVSITLGFLTFEAREGEGSIQWRISTVEWSTLKDRHAYLAVLHKLFVDKFQVRRREFDHETWLLRQFTVIGLRPHLS